MDKETKDIVKLIAGIQIESLNSIKEDVKNGNDIAQDLIKKLLQIEDDEIIRALDEHTELYGEIENTPQMINMLSEYQMLVCSHILFRMEDEWVHTNSQGVLGTWAIFQRANLKFHPELTLLKFNIDMKKNEYLESVEMNTGVEMIPCESSNIEGFGYDSKKKQLWVAFKDNRVYRYDDVPYEICNELHQAESKGKYLAKNIKNKFETTGYELRN